MNAGPTRRNGSQLNDLRIDLLAQHLGTPRRNCGKGRATAPHTPGQGQYGES